MVSLGEVLLKMSRTHQTLFLMGADMHLVFTDRLIRAGQVDFRMVVQCRPGRKGYEEHPQQNK